MVPRDLQRLLSDWHAASRFRGRVCLSIDHDPPIEPHLPFRRVCAAVFQPRAMDGMQAVVMLDERGRVGVALEGRDRVARRLGLQPMAEGFAGLFGPHETGADALVELLEQAASGRLAVRYGRAWRALTQLSLVMQQEDTGVCAGPLLPRIARPVARIATRHGVLGGVLAYAPW